MSARSDTPGNASGTEHGRVLFVDDEVAMTQGVRLMMRHQDFEVITANSAAEALELLEETAVDVVVSDQRMPGMNGSDFLSILRVSHPDVVRIMFSGEADFESAARAINEAEIYRFLIKPCAPEELIKCMLDALSLAAERQHRTRRKREADFEDEAKNGLFECALGSAWMAFQPVVDPRAKRTVAFESLLRLDHPEVPHPGALLKLAEDVGRVSEVEHFVLRSVAARIPDAPEDATILVNVHPQTLDEISLTELFEPLAPFAERVVIEIIEREALEDTVELQDRLESLRSVGFRIAIDDLGAGYSGLTSFVLLKPDIVKFDMGLVRGIDRDPTRAKLVEALTRLSKDLGITTIAEGVETAAELATVTRLGCDWVQGFIYGRAERDFRSPSVRAA